jgi:hypothetical protein
MSEESHPCPICGQQMMYYRDTMQWQGQPIEENEMCLVGHYLYKFATGKTWIKVGDQSWEYHDDDRCNDLVTVRQQVNMAIRQLKQTHERNAE